MSEPCGQRGPSGDCPEPAQYVVTVTHLHGFEDDGPVELAACPEHTAELRRYYPDSIVSVTTID